MRYISGTSGRHICRLFQGGFLLEQCLQKRNLSVEHGKVVSIGCDCHRRVWHGDWDQRVVNSVGQQEIPLVDCRCWCRAQTEDSQSINDPLVVVRELGNLKFLHCHFRLLRLLVLLDPSCLLAVGRARQLQAPRATLCEHCERRNHNFGVLLRQTRLRVGDVERRRSRNGE